MTSKHALIILATFMFLICHAFFRVIRHHSNSGRNHVGKRLIDSPLNFSVVAGGIKDLSMDSLGLLSLHKSTPPLPVKPLPGINNIQLTDIKSSELAHDIRLTDINPSELAHDSLLRCNCLLHMFTTFMETTEDQNKLNAYDEVLKNYRNMHGHRVQMWLFTDSSEYVSKATAENVIAIRIPRKGSNGMPILSSMFDYVQKQAQLKQEKCSTKNIEFYMYFNGDILFDENLPLTIQSIQNLLNEDHAMAQKGILVVGKRTNFHFSPDVQMKMSNGHKIQTLALQSGKLFQNNAQDYFICTYMPHFWRNIPDFVIGRLAYDNWLVDQAWHDKGKILIDATKTILAVHLTTKDGNLAGHAKGVDSHYNFKLFDYAKMRNVNSNDWDHGTTDHAEYFTELRDAKVAVIRKKDKVQMYPKPLSQSASKQRFQVHVLTMKRAKSLQRLLKSLEATEYGGGEVELIIHVDHHADNQACIAAAQEFEFSHGSKKIDIASKNKGLRDSWLQAWKPSKNERAIVLEDDIELSSKWFVWLNSAWDAYGSISDVAGISLQRQTLIPKKPHRTAEIVNDHIPFLYSLVGSIAFSPHWKHWSDFLDWTKSVDLSSVNVQTKDLVTSDWFDMLDKRHMWTQYFIWYCKTHNLFTLYVNLPNGQTLASHMRETGEHYKHTEGRDFPIAVNMKPFFPKNLVRYTWSGSVVVKPDVNVKEEEDDYVKLIGSIHNDLITAKDASGIVVIMVLNEAFIPFAQNWLCNTALMKGVHERTLFIFTDDGAKKIKKHHNRAHYSSSKLRIHKNFQNNMRYGSYGYWKLVSFRIAILNAILKLKIPILLCEPDALWVQNPLQDPMMHSTDDIIGFSDAGDIPGFGWLRLNPSEKVRSLFLELQRKFDSQLRHEKQINENINVVPEQQILRDLIKVHNDIRVKILPTDKYVNGKWYDKKTSSQGTLIKQNYKETGIPYVINNNWIEGNEKKISRAKQWGHWFIQNEEEKSCSDLDQLRRKFSDIVMSMKSSISLAGSLHDRNVNRIESLSRKVPRLRSTSFTGQLGIMEQIPPAHLGGCNRVLVHRDGTVKLLLGDGRPHLSHLANFRKLIAKVVEKYGPLDTDFHALLDTSDNPICQGLNHNKATRIRNPHLTFGYSDCNLCDNVVVLPGIHKYHVRVTAHLLMNDPFDWASKPHATAVWHGDRNGYLALDRTYQSNLTKIPREIIVDMAQQHPDLLQASFVKVPWDQMLRHKYIVAVSGNAFPSILGPALHSQSCVFLQEQRAPQWFYPFLEPWVHYVPVKFDLVDLIEKIQWARNNDDKCRRIALNGRDFARKWFTAEAQLDYTYHKFKELFWDTLS